MTSRRVVAAIALPVLIGLVSAARAEGLSDALNPFGNYYNNVARAAENNDVARVRSLLASGNNANQQEGDSQQTGLQWAAINGNIQITAILIKAGARLNDADKLGNTAMHYAAEHNQVEILKLLLDVGAAVDPQNHDGMTPLMTAARAGNVEIVRTLLSRGANPNKADYTGRDALGWAADSHRQALIAMLQDATKKR